MNRLIPCLIVCLFLFGCAQYPRTSKVAGAVIAVPVVFMGGAGLVELGMRATQPSPQGTVPGYSEPIPTLDQCWVWC